MRDAVTRHGFTAAAAAAVHKQNKSAARGFRTECLRLCFVVAVNKHDLEYGTFHPRPPLVAHKFMHYLHPVCWLPESAEFMIQVHVLPLLVCSAECRRNALTYRYTIGMVAWNLTPRAAAVYSGPVRRRLEGEPSLWARTLDSVWSLDSGTRDSQDSRIRPFVRWCWLLLKQPLRFSDLLRIHKSSGGVVLLAQQSVQPRIPKSGLTTPCKDWEIWGQGLDQDRRPHMFLDPSENDVITGKGERDKEMLLWGHDCVWNASRRVSFRSRYCEKLNLTRSQCHKQHRPLGNRKYLHFQEKWASDFTSCLRGCYLAKFNDSPWSKWQPSSSEGNYLALVCALSSSQSCFFFCCC